jgi:hypothetical protein
MRGPQFMAPQFSLRGQVNGMDDSEEIFYQVRVHCIVYDIYVFLTMSQALILKVAGKGQKSHLVAIIKGRTCPISTSCLLTYSLVPEAQNHTFIEPMVLIQ